ncbi:MAG: hypothetical protein ABL889_21125 [Terricaulis sp.]
MSATLTSERPVDAMELPEFVLLDAEALQAAFCVGDEFFGPAVLAPNVGTAAREAAFGGDKDIVGVGRERFADQLFGDVGAVGFRRVDEVDAEFGRALEYGDGFGFVVRRAPDAFAGNAHGAEAQPVHFKFAADFELA